MNARSTATCLLASAAALACVAPPAASAQQRPGGRSEPATLAEAREGLVTEHRGEEPPDRPVEPPPAGVAKVVTYDSPVGPLKAYLTTPRDQSKKHPAVIWCSGGDFNSIGGFFRPSTADNDQTAAAFREAGVVTLYPSLRGGNDNPGRREGFLGEVDDVLAAADYLETVPYVDKDRVYLAGHSTGATLALLVAEMTDRFPATVAFGPVTDPRGYGDDFITYDPKNRREASVRAPLLWLKSLTTPTFVVEGAGRPGNVGEALEFRRLAGGTPLTVLTVPGKDHFSVLRPGCRALAEKILAATADEPSIRLTTADILKQDVRADRP